MQTHRAAAPLSLLVVLAGVLCLYPPPAALASSAQAALSPSAYRVGSLCSAPSPGHSGCLGLRLVAKRPLSQRGSRTHTTPVAPAAAQTVKQIEFLEPWEGSLSPLNVLTAYSLSGVPAPAAQQTLALVDAFDDPTAEHDLEVFDKQYGLPPCTTANGCFTKVTLGEPATEPGWAQEIATDIEVAHGVCQGCKILLVEAASNINTNLEEAEQEAERLGATEISNSWGGPEQGVTAGEDDASPFRHPDTVITAAAGDDGYLDWGAKKSSERGFADYPASSPHVVAVGGTRLSLTGSGAWEEETVWNGSGASGGGCSTVLTASAWQQSVADWSAVGCGTHRAVADVSADADPFTGVAVYDSTPIKEGEFEYRGWVTIGGTSVASPIIAATFALAGGSGTGPGGKAVEYPAQTLYENLAGNPGVLHDVVSGSNGACTKGFDKNTGISKCSSAEEEASCSAEAICLARTGYDGPTGVGTPNGISAFRPGDEEEKLHTEEKLREAEKQREEKRLAEKQAAEEKQREEERREEREREAKKKAEESQQSSGLGANGSSGVGSTDSPLIEPPALAGSSALVPILSAPALTQTANAALSHGRPKVSRISFTFKLNVPARVRVTLAKQVTAHGRKRWQTLPFSRTIAGVAGRNHTHLSAPGTLAPGRYRLVLVPERGTARSLTFSIG